MKKKQQPRRLWSAMIVGIAGLVIGYSFVIIGEGKSAFAATMYQCPMHHSEICKGAACGHTV